jgi:superfamily II DNA or RNA helicase
MIIDYQKFLESKRLVVSRKGIEVSADDINESLFPFQRDVTKWSLRKGCAGVFLDPGLGKTFIQLQWGDLISKKKVLIVAPLSVARQTVREAKKLGMTVKYCRSQDDVTGKISVTNYEMLKHFRSAEFDAVVFDESSIFAALGNKTRRLAIEMFFGTPYKLCCTATPIPNDTAEIANHAEVLGVMRRVDMLATFFVHDDEGWRLKSHAEKPFYRWLASWGISIKKPSDLGYSDEGFRLPPLTVTPIFVDTEFGQDFLSASKLKGIQDRVRVRKQTINAKLDIVADLVKSSNDQWIIWCGLNDEATKIHKIIGNGFNVHGSMTPEEKATLFESFQDGQYQNLVSKLGIAGFGMNFQNCHNMIFFGLNDSWQFMFQGIGRCHRFGQIYPVNAYIVLADVERPIYDNVMRKQREADYMSKKLIEHVREYEKEEIGAIYERSEYTATVPMRMPAWLGAR